MDSKGFQRITKDSKGLERISKDSERFQRNPKKSEGFQRIPMDSKGFQRIPKDSIGFQRIPKDFKGFQRIPMDSKKFFAEDIDPKTHLQSIKKKKKCVVGHCFVIGAQKFSIFREADCWFLQLICFWLCCLNKEPHLNWNDNIFPSKDQSFFFKLSFFPSHLFICFIK